MEDPARWISVGELAEAFGPDNFTPPATADLAGTAHVLNLEDRGKVEYVFMSEGRLAWDGERGGAVGARGEAQYFAAKVRDGIYLVDFVSQKVPPTSVTLVLDLGRGIATRVVGTLPDSADVGHSLMARITAGQELTAVTAAFSSAALDAPHTAHTPRHQPTSELVGRRVEYAYSPTERYEHIYLNEDFFTWHCLSGWEKGLGDTDRCHHFKLAEQLYLFVWREKIVPTLGVLTIDFIAMRTMGKILGHAQDGSAGVVDFAVGARARLLNITLNAPALEEGMTS
jgi:hypothetical protein